MKVSLIRSYRNQKGTVVFVYGVTGKPGELEDFKEAQGDEYYREDEETGKPLWFTSRYIGDTGNLIITSAGKIVPDMSELDKAASLTAQYGGNFGEELARAAAQKFVGSKSSMSSKTPVSKPAVEPVDSAEDDVF